MMGYSREQYSPLLEAKKLAELTQIEGYDSALDMLEEAVFDSVCPSICMNAGCDYTTEMEPDQDAGWCECCDTNTVQSGLILAGLI